MSLEPGQTLSRYRLRLALTHLVQVIGEAAYDCLGVDEDIVWQVVT